MKKWFELILTVLLLCMPLEKLWARGRVNTSRSLPSTRRSSFSSNHSLGSRRSGSLRDYSPSPSRRNTSSFSTPRRSSTWGTPSRSRRSNSNRYPTFTAPKFSAPRPRTSNSREWGRSLPQVPSRGSYHSGNSIQRRAPDSRSRNEPSRYVFPSRSQPKTAPRSIQRNAVSKPITPSRGSSRGTTRFSPPTRKVSSGEQWKRYEPKSKPISKTAPTFHTPRPENNHSIKKPSRVAPALPTVRRNTFDYQKSTPRVPTYRTLPSTRYTESQRIKAAPLAPSQNGSKYSIPSRKKPSGLQWQDKTSSKPSIPSKYHGQQLGGSHSVNKPAYSGKQHDQYIRPERPAGSSSKLKRPNWNKPDSQSGKYSKDRGKTSTTKDWPRKPIIRPPKRSEPAYRFNPDPRRKNEFRPRPTDRPSALPGYVTPVSKLNRYHFKDIEKKPRPEKPHKHDRYDRYDRYNRYDRYDRYDLRKWDYPYGRWDWNWNRDRRYNWHSDRYWSRLNHYRAYRCYPNRVHYHFYFHDNYSYHTCYPWGNCYSYGSGYFSPYHSTSSVYYYENWRDCGVGFSRTYSSGWCDDWYGGIDYAVNPWNTYRNIYYFPQTTYVQPVPRGNELIGVNGQILQPAPAEQPTVAPPAQPSAEPTEEPSPEAPVVAPFATPVYPENPQRGAQPPAILPEQEKTPLPKEKQPLLEQEQTGPNFESADSPQIPQSPNGEKAERPIDQQEANGKAPGFTCTCLCHCDGVRPCTCEYPCGSEYLLTKEFCQLNFVSVFETFDPEIILRAYFEGDLFPLEDDFEEEWMEE